MAYLQMAIGHSVDDPTLKDIEEAISNINLDEEHAAFWYGTDDEEIVLETHGNLKCFLVLDGENQFTRQFNSWNEIVELYRALLENRWSDVKNKFEA